MKTSWKLGFAALATASSLLSLPSEAAAQSAVQLGLRAGYAVPMGDIAKDQKFNDFVTGAIPLQLDVLARATPNLLLGGYAGLAYGFSNCDEHEGEGMSADCSAMNYRLGVQGQYHFSPEGNTNPWLGVGIGYEWLTNSAEVSYDTGFGGGSATTDINVRGWEFLTLQGGVDFRASSAVSVGPYLSFAVGDYDEVHYTFSAGDQSREEATDISGEALHQWLTVGIRGTFDL